MDGDLDSGKATPTPATPSKNAIGPQPSLDELKARAAALAGRVRSAGERPPPDAAHSWLFDAVEPPDDDPATKIPADVDDAAPTARIALESRVIVALVSKELRKERLGAGRRRVLAMARALGARFQTNVGRQWLAEAVASRPFVLSATRRHSYRDTDRRLVIVAYRLTESVFGAGSVKKARDVARAAGAVFRDRDALPWLRGFAPSITPADAAFYLPQYDAIRDPEREPRRFAHRKSPREPGFKHKRSHREPGFVRKRSQS